ncbi:MAG: pentapeptide repeat-containing protein, partial [Candidatus Fonsibacter ubiquis]
YADLRDANLQGADLQGAIGLAIAADAPARLVAVAQAALAEPEALDMNTWHQCNTTHCIAGWAVAQAGEPGRLLEAAMGPEVAGLMLLGIEAHTHFYDDNDDARAWLQEVLKR